MFSRSSRTVCLCALGSLALPGAGAWAQPLTTAFLYQGELRTTGVPASGLHDLRFRLYDAAAGGLQLGTTVCNDNVSLANGRFTVPLDFGAQFAGQRRWLEIEVRADTGMDCLNLTGFVLLSPRQELAGAPNALFALNAANAIAATNATQLNGQGAAFYQNASNLTSGTLPGGLLSGTYAGAINLSNASNIFGGSGAALSSVNADLLDGLNSTAFLQSIPNPLMLSGTSATHIIRGENASTGGGARAVYGLMTGASGATYGVVGESASNSGRGVYGFAGAGSGITYGVYGQSDSTAGYAVYGLATAATGVTYGGQFQSASTDGRGVFGWATATTGAAYGVVGTSDAAGGRGVVGTASATTGFSYGVWGQSASTSGRAVFARASAASGTTYGVYGQSDSPDPTAFGVWAQGRLGASGVKSFRIDHPDDPENRYLLHYSAESPEVINFYSGKATLDGAGEAVVELPHYFAKINKDPRYMLTAVGAPMPMLHVAEEIDEAALSAGARAGPEEAAPTCSFRIAGGAPGAKVSWEVKAVRNDKWVQQRGAPVEVEKQGLEKGTYQHPELYPGAPGPEKGMNHNPIRERPDAHAGRSIP